MGGWVHDTAFWESLETFRVAKESWQTINEVAAAAGVSRSAIIYHIQSGNGAAVRVKRAGSNASQVFVTRAPEWK